MVKQFIKKEPVLVCAWAAALISSFAVTPNLGYIEYIDFRTLSLLFCLMAVTCALKELNIFKIAGLKLLSNVKTSVQLELILIMLCFFSSMLITNDVSLITFVPFAISTLKMADIEDRITFVVVMQTIAANLGSIVTPIGNPQNIYIFTKYSVPTGSFFITMLPYGIMSFLIIVLFTVFRKNMPLNISKPNGNTKIANKKFVVFYFALFILSVMSVGRIIPVKIVFIIIVLSLLIFNRKLFKQIDYSLLATFTGFFIFIGNIGKINSFQSFISSFISGNEILTAVLSSQIMSNVPSVLLLSGFTDKWKELLIGVNIGGLGTLIASMASLISYKFASQFMPDKKLYYLKIFTILNLVFLLILSLLCVFLKAVSYKYF